MGRKSLVVQSRNALTVSLGKKLIKNKHETSKYTFSTSPEKTEAFFFGLILFPTIWYKTWKITELNFINLSFTLKVTFK